METYYLAWKILGVGFILFITYCLFVVRGQKKQKYEDNSIENN